MENNTQKVKRSFERYLDLFGNICAFLLGSLISIWVIYQIIAEVESIQQNILLYTVYGILLFLCLLGLVMLGKKIWKDLSRWQDDK